MDHEICIEYQEPATEAICWDMTGHGWLKAAQSKIISREILYSGSLANIS